MTVTVLKKNIDTLIAAIVGFMMVILLTNHGGVGISPDSVTYIATARHFLEGKFLIGHDDTPVVLFPGMYPFFLSLIMRITANDILNIGNYVNAGLFALVIFLSGIIMQQFKSPSQWYKRVVLSCLCVSPSLLDVFTMLWSETLFIVWIIVFMICVFYYYRDQSNTSFLCLLFIVAVAPVIRYAGISIVATACLFLLIQRDIPFKRKAINITLVIIAGLSLLSLNLYRNQLVSGTLTGLRQKGVTSFFTNMKYVGLVFIDWLPFIKTNDTLAVLLTILFVVVAAILFAYKYFGNIENKSYEFIALGFFVAYSSFIMLVATASRFETINNRMIAPLYICWLWSFTFFIPSLYRIIVVKRKKIAAILLIGLSILAFQYNQISTVYNWYKINSEAGIGGYAEDIWDASPTLYFIKQNKNFFEKNIIIYANANEPVYLFSNKIVQSLPERVHTKIVEQFLSQKEFYIIWLNLSGNPDYINMDEISKFKKVKSLITFSDGAIYKCTAP